MVFSSILQNNEPKPKIFWEKMGTKHPLNTTDSKTKICKAMARMVVGQETNMVVDYRTKQNQLN